MGAPPPHDAPSERVWPDPLPDSYGGLEAFLTQDREINLFGLRLETFRRIEKETGRPLLCYATQTVSASSGAPVSIDDGDLIGFSDLIGSVSDDTADVFLISNGGSAEASERIVRQLRGRFKNIRFLVPSNAYSAATLLCFSGDEVLMLPEGTLGPIDPQLNGVPVRAIKRAFETLEERLAKEGPGALTAYVPLLQKYDLHLLEQCQIAQDLSSELALTWLTKYGMKNAPRKKVETAVEFFGDWDLHKSHGRSIGVEAARQIGIPATLLTGSLADLIRSLYHQYVFFFEKTHFCKVFENARGIAWGRHYAQEVINIPLGKSHSSPKHCLGESTPP